MQNGVPFPGAGGPAQANMPTPQQIQEIQQQFMAEAQRQGLTPQEFAEKIRAVQAAMRQQAAAQQGQAGEGAEGEGAEGGQGQGQGQGPTPEQLEALKQHMMQQQQQQQQQGPQPIQPGPPKPEAIEVAKFLKGQELKSRPAILQEKRKEMFKVKRAIRALQSPAYEKARSKNPLLPPVTDRASAENVFKLLPLSMLAIRVTRLDGTNNPAHGEPGHQHGGVAKTKKGAPWNVRIEQQQDAADEMHYIWFYEGSQLKQRLMAVGVLALVITVVLFPLWPLFLRRGVWYLSMGALGLLAAFFGLAIVRLIWFLISLVVLPPGVWLYPNLFEDVGFFDSFRPVWAWRETKESLAVKKAEKKAKRAERKAKKQGGGVPVGAAASSGPAAVHEAAATSASGAEATPAAVVERRSLKASVEEADDE